MSKQIIHEVKEIMVKLLLAANWSARIKPLLEEVVFWLNEMDAVNQHYFSGVASIYGTVRVREIAQLKITLSSLVPTNGQELDRGLLIKLLRDAQRLLRSATVGCEANEIDCDKCDFGKQFNYSKTLFCMSDRHGEDFRALAVVRELLDVLQQLAQYEDLSFIANQQSAVVTGGW